MHHELAFRITFALILVTTACISAYHRAQARKKTGGIARRAEDPKLILLRLLFALPLASVLFLYIFQPEWLDWAQVDLPNPARWGAALLAAATIPFIFWVFRSLGANISETILTRENQQLVKHGPYRWIRHPLYTGAVTMLLGLSVVAANWLMGLIVLAVLMALPFLARREEAELRARFGSAYADYIRATGRFMPKLRRI